MAGGRSASNTPEVSSGTEILAYAPGSIRINLVNAEEPTGEQSGHHGQGPFQQLQQEQPGVFPDNQLRTLQRRVKDWRRDVVKHLLFGAEESLTEGSDIVVATSTRDNYFAVTFFVEAARRDFPIVADQSRWGYSHESAGCHIRRSA